MTEYNDGQIFLDGLINKMKIVINRCKTLYESVRYSYFCIYAIHNQVFDTTKK